MKQIYLVALASLTMLASCDYFMYTPRFKSQKRREQPSIFICERIVDFRLEEGRWPNSKEEMMAKGKKYQDVFNGFKYTWTDFKIKDSNTMTFYFEDHITDNTSYEETGKSELNTYGGRVIFYKVKDKFAYTIKMH
ncbi:MULTISPECIES: hypothetical protein [Niastella]|uniref:Lipoprotein n=1 Tax=Niastella soli TaxID=2821487 RepID=A0ABS3YV15_9BACT|nr:hypothetical protein [Niastella soli]MBO9201769.1 hypothetical protein [Niastella soli]